MPGRGHHRQPRRGADPLDEDARLEALGILVAREDKGRYFHAREAARQAIDRRAPRLYPAQRVGRAQRRMFGELFAEFAESARILVLQLHARRADLIGRYGLWRAQRLEAARHRLRVAQELGTLVGIGAVAGADYGERARHLRVAQPEMQRGVTPHRAADDVRPSDAQVAHHVGNVVGGERLRVLRCRFRHVGGEIAARIEGDAAVTAAEVAHLRLPAAQISRELVDEHDREPRSGLLVVELHAFRVYVGHRYLPNAG